MSRVAVSRSNWTGGMDAWRLRTSFHTPLPEVPEFPAQLPLAAADFERTEEGWECSLPGEPLIAHVVAQEELSAGEHVRGFRVEAFPAHYGPPITVYQGESLGHKAICSFPPLRARKVRFRLLAADGDARLRGLEVHPAVECR